MKRHCPTCRARYRGQCVHDDVVGSDLDTDIEGEPQTKLGVSILAWMAESLYAVVASTAEASGEAGVRVEAGPCPGWGRR